MRGRDLWVLACWLVSRLWLAWLLAGPQAWVGGDVGYFDSSLRAVGDIGLGDVLVEYPFPAVGAVAIPWAVASLTGLPYGVTLFVAAAGADLAFTLLLRARAVGSGRWPIGCWLAAVPLLGATAFARFDLLPGVLVGCALLLIAGWPRVAAACLAVATAVKLWPVVLAAPLLAATPKRAAVVAYVGVGAVLAVATGVLAGPGRLLTPLSYQVERGLQVESVAATPAMLAWWLQPETWSVGYAPSRAFEVAGPGVDRLLAASTLASVLYGAAVVAAGLVLAMLWRRGQVVAPGTLVWCGLVAVLGFVVTGKVLSPQYLLWLLPLAVAGLVVADGLALRRWTLSLLAATALTQVVFPYSYGAVTVGAGARWVPVLALTARNLILVLLLVVAATEAWRRLREELSGAGRSRASLPGRR